MTQQELIDRVEERRRNSVDVLKAFIFQRSASIAKSISDDVGEHWGSGSYIEAAGHVHLLTNRHVAEEAQNTTLTHVVINGEVMEPLSHPFATAAEADIALMPVALDVWAKTDKIAVPVDKLNADRPADDELLMLVGFPKRGSRFSAIQGAVRSRAMPLMSQRDREITDDGVHFWMKYRPAELKDETGHVADFTEPFGLSGSLVWNTGIVKSVLDGIDWSTDLVKPAGLLMGWRDQQQVLQVVRLDVVRDVVKAMLVI